MIRKALLIGLMCLAGATAAGAAGVAPPGLTLYHQISGGEEGYLVEKPVNIGRVALERGMRWELVARQNKLAKPYRLKKGMTLKIDNTHILPTDISNGIVINLPELNLYYFKDGVYQRRYALAVGKPSWPTPTGNFTICEKRKNPTWNVPESIQEEMDEQGLDVVEQVPPGPRNPLGKYWMGTTASGVGIHATNRPWSVGYYVSHGCIRMLPDEIAKLFPEIKVGTPVKILYRPIKMALTDQGRIYLEAHPNIYGRKMEPLALVKETARKNQLEDKIDWDRVPKILKAREGIARDITKEPPPPKATTTAAPAPQEMRLFPLQEKEAKLE